jgi:hypothetical protein
MAQALSSGLTKSERPTMRTALALLLLVTPAFAEDWPPEVTVIVEESKSICNGGFSFAPEAVTQRDLNGDGTSDWVVDSGLFQCSDSYGTYCGTHGCNLYTLIDGTPGALLLHGWDTVTENGNTYLTAINNAGETIRFLWSGSDWVLQ